MHGLEREHGVAGLGWALVQAKQHLAAHHKARQLAGVGVGGALGGYDPALAQDADAIGEGDDFGHFVGDEDDRLPLRLHHGKDPAQILGLLRGEHGGGLIEDDDIGATVDELEDLHTLLFADAELPDVGAWVDLEPITRRELADARLDRSQVGHEGQIRDAQHDVLRHGHRGNQHKVLVNHTDPQRGGIARRVNLGRPALDEDLARIGAIEAGEDVHQGALARTVFTQECQHLARVEVQIDAIIGQNAGKALGDAVHLQHGWGNGWLYGTGGHDSS